MEGLKEFTLYSTLAVAAGLGIGKGMNAAGKLIVPEDVQQRAAVQNLPLDEHIRATVDRCSTALLNMD